MVEPYVLPKFVRQSKQYGRTMKGWTPVFYILLNIFIVNNIKAQCVATYPFAEDFESGNGGWITGGANSDWTYGTPSKTRISAAGSGIYCWITGGLNSASYSGGQKSWLQSPCFDFSTLQRPLVEFLIFWDTERQYDGGNLQYSLDGGLTWVNVGNASTSTDCRRQNWYNENSINNLTGLANPRNGWSGTTLSSAGGCLGGNGSGQWRKAVCCLSELSGEPEVKFRFTFCSGTTCNNYDGMAVDSFSIRDLPLPAIDFTLACESPEKVNFFAIGTVCPRSLNWDFNDPSSSLNTGTGVQVSHVFSGPGIYKVSFTADEPCIGTVTQTRSVLIAGVNSLLVPESCPGSADASIGLEISPPGLFDLVWNTQPPLTGTNPTGLSAGTYNFTLLSDSGCTRQGFVEVTTDPGGYLNPVLPENILYCPGEILNLTPGAFDSYLWSDGSTDSVLTVSDTGWYAVTVTNLSGCTGSDSVRIRKNCFTDVFLPAAFSPNNDGLNDVFRAYAEETTGFSLTVYNRWQQAVYFTNLQDGYWDGTADGLDCPSGVYVWEVRYKDAIGKNRTKWGNVLLIR